MICPDLQERSICDWPPAPLVLILALGLSCYAHRLTCPHSDLLLSCFSAWLLLVKALVVLFYPDVNELQIIWYLSCSGEQLGAAAGRWAVLFGEERSSSTAMGRGRWPMPAGCCRPAACSSAARTWDRR